MKEKKHFSCHEIQLVNHRMQCVFYIYDRQDKKNSISRVIVRTKFIIYLESRRYLLLKMAEN